MASWDDVVALALALPETTADTWYRTPAVKVAKKGFLRLRTESDGAAVFLCELDEKDALLATGDPAFYTTPHYDGHGAILVDLARVDPTALPSLVARAWAIKAPPRLRKAHPVD